PGLVAQLESLEWPLDAAATYMLPRFRSGRTHSVAMAALVPAIRAFNARRRGCAGQAPDVRDARDREKGATRGCAMMMKIRIAVVARVFQVHMDGSATSPCGAFQPARRPAGATDRSCRLSNYPGHGAVTV